MLFVAEYELDWEALEAVVAKRIEWTAEQPDDFRFVGEYVWKDRDPPFRGMAIIDAPSVEALNAFVLHYGPTLTMRIHPATDVTSAIAQIGGASSPSGTRKAHKRAAR